MGRAARHLGDLGESPWPSARLSASKFSSLKDPKGLKCLHGRMLGFYV